MAEKTSRSNVMWLKDKSYEDVLPTFAAKPRTSWPICATKHNGFWDVVFPCAKHVGYGTERLIEKEARMCKRAMLGLGKCPNDNGPCRFWLDTPAGRVYQELEEEGLL